MTSENDMPSELDLPAPWQSDALERARRFGKGSLSPFSDVLIRLYRFRRLRPHMRRFCNRLEHGPIHSQTWLKILARYHNVHIGRYSYGAILNPQAAGLQFQAIVHVQLTRHSDADLTAFIRGVETRAEVVECYATTGQSDYQMRVLCRDLEAYNAFLETFLFRLPAVASAQTNVVLREIKRNTGIGF